MKKAILLLALPLAFGGCSPALANPLAELEVQLEKDFKEIEVQWQKDRERVGMSRFALKSVDVANKKTGYRYMDDPMLFEGRPVMEPFHVVPRYRYHRTLLCLYMESGYVEMAEDTRKRIAMMKPYVK